MPNFFSRQIALVACCFALLAGCALAAGSEHNAPKVGRDRVSTSKALIRAMYPGLVGRGLSVSIRDWSSLDLPESLNWFELQISTPRREAVPHSHARMPDDPSNNARSPAQPALSLAPDEGGKVVLGTRFVYQGAENLPDEYLTGSFDSEKSKNLSLLLNTHHDWSDEKCNEASQEAGAQFGAGDRDKLLKKFPVQEFSKILGPSRVKKINYLACGTLWVVTLQVRPPGRKELTYYFSIEPFEGRVTGFNRAPNAKSRLP